VEHHCLVCREEDEVLTQTAAERAYDVASLEPRGQATLQRFSLAVHWQKSNCRTLVQMQVDKAIRKERELKLYMLELKEMHKFQLLQERKAKRAAIKSSKRW